MNGQEADKRPRRGQGKAGVEPAFISGAEIAREMCTTTESLYEWVAKSHFPPPRCRPGASRLWLRVHWDSFVVSGRWPKEAWSAIHA